MTPRRPVTAAFFVGFLLVALVAAGGLSYLADPNPDGLDTVTLQGCTAVATPAGERLEGRCIAQNATDPATAGSPLAGYSLLGGEDTVGVAGAVGVLVTLAVTVGAFRLLRRRGTGTRR